MQVLEDFQIEFTRFDPTDPRLGRQRRWDSRSKAFFIPEADSYSDIKSVTHKCYIPMLNQGDIGSCTGDTGTEVMGSDDLWYSMMDLLSVTDENLDQQYAYQLYSDTTKTDPYPGYWDPSDPASQDTGSDGLSTAQTLKKRGLISGYTHGNSLLSALTGLQARSGMTGTVWKGDMFNPTSDGQLRCTGNVEGGHEYTLFAVDADNRRVWMRNHWGEWGVGYPGYADTGCAWMSWDDYEELLVGEQGDFTLLIPNTEPAPTPAPVPPSPPSVDPADSKFATQLKSWLGRRPFFYHSTQDAAKDWMNARGL